MSLPQRPHLSTGTPGGAADPGWRAQVGPTAGGPPAAGPGSAGASADPGRPAASSVPMPPVAVPAVAGTRRDDRGEGVISTAIAVLILAFLGAAMWLGFKAMWSDTEQRVNDKVSEIGS